MTTNPITIPGTATVDEATRLMAHLAIRHLLVVDGTGHMIGIVSDRDLRGPLSRRGRTRSDTLDPAQAVSGVMTHAPITAAPDADVAAIGRLMYEKAIGALPILDDAGTPVGIVSYVDVLRRMVDDERTSSDENALDLMDRDEFVPHPAK